MCVLLISLVNNDFNRINVQSSHGRKGMYALSILHITYLP